MRPKLESQPGDFLLLLQAALTYIILRRSPRLLLFPPSTKDLQQYTQYTSVIILDILETFQICPISKYILANTKFIKHTNPTIPNHYLSLTMDSSASRYVPHSTFLSYTKWWLLIRSLIQLQQGD